MSCLDVRCLALLIATSSLFAVACERPSPVARETAAALPAPEARWWPFSDRLAFSGRGFEAAACDLSLEAFETPSPSRPALRVWCGGLPRPLTISMEGASLRSVPDDRGASEGHHALSGRLPVSLDAAPLGAIRGRRATVSIAAPLTLAFDGHESVRVELPPQWITPALARTWRRGKVSFGVSEPPDDGELGALLVDASGDLRVLGHGTQLSHLDWLVALEPCRDAADAARIKVVDRRTGKPLAERRIPCPRHADAPAATLADAGPRAWVADLIAQARARSHPSS